MEKLISCTIKNFLAAVFFAVSLPSCAAAPPSGKPVEHVEPKIDMPGWILHYDSGNRICGVGTSLPHIRGIAHQRAVAVSRAIDEIAKQLNVTVDAKLEHYMTGSGIGVSSGLSTYSVQTTNGQSVKARIIDAWMNNRSREFYVLMCMD